MYQADVLRNSHLELTAKETVSFKRSTAADCTISWLILLSLLVRIRSKLLPPICVGSLTSWERLLLKQRSQNRIENRLEPFRVDQSMSGKLKPPMTMSNSDVRKVRLVLPGVVHYN